MNPRIPTYVDTHSHLDSDIYARDLDVVVKKALDEGVWIVTLGSDLESSRKAVAIAERYPEGVFAAVGLHPKKVPVVAAHDATLIDLSPFAELARHPKVVAIGETGLDYSEFPQGTRGGPMRQLAEQAKANQKKVFGRFMDLSRELRLPMLLHCREAHEDMLTMLETWDKTTRGFDSRGIVHCFSGSWKQARRYFNLDFVLSVTGTVTHGGYQEEVIRKAPATHLAIESDCPHMAQVPWGSRRNEPSYLHVVADGVAVTRGEKPAQVAADTTRNAMRVLRKML